MPDHLLRLHRKSHCQALKKAKKCEKVGDTHKIIKFHGETYNSMGVFSLLLKGESGMKFFGTPVGSFALFLFALAVSGPAQAKETTQIESITITANKMEENVQDVSASTTIFSEKSIADLRLESIADVAAFTPNFMLYENGMSGVNAPSMRGMFADIHSHSVSAGMYVDGVPILDGMAYEQEMLDIERIEVLKGPQGTLYGKSSEAGVINIVTKQPDNTFSGKVSGEVGIDHKQKVSMSLSGPIKKDRLYLGVPFILPCFYSGQEQAMGFPGT